MTPRVAFIILAALSALACAPQRPKTAAVQVVIDQSRRFQTLEGWETTLRTGDVDKANNRFDARWRAISDEIAAALVDEAGINRVRLEVHSGAENPVDQFARFMAGEETQKEWSAHLYDAVNDNDDPRLAAPGRFQWSLIDHHVESLVLPMQARLAARGERLYVALCVVDFDTGAQGTLNLAGAPEEYAELVAETFSHLGAKYGLTPDALEIILEPDNAGPWARDAIGPAAVAAKRRLAERGFHPAIIAPSSKDARAAIALARKARAAGAEIDVIAYHSYDSPSDAERRKIRDYAHAFGARTAMLEHLKANVNELYRDLTEADVVAFQQWGAANLIDNGNYYLVADPGATAGARVSLSRRARGLSQIFRHARIGDRRIAATTDAAEIRPLAFIRPDGGVFAAAIADKAQKVVFNGLPPGDYDVEVTTGGLHAMRGLRRNVGADGRAETTIDGPGVIAIFPAQSATRNEEKGGIGQ